MKHDKKPIDNHDAAGEINSGGRTTQPQGRDSPPPSRGSSMQGELQNAKGGPAGANQGGAPRGGSRIEPSHQQRANKSARSKK